MKYFIVVILTLFVFSCTQKNNTDIFNSSRDNTIDVKSKIKPIDTDGHYFGMYTQIKLADKYLVFSDQQSNDKFIHIFDKNTLEHKASFGDLGQGPYEISELGDVVWNPYTKELLVVDFGSMNFYSYNIDSVICMKNYNPYIKTRLEPTNAIIESYFIDENIAFARSLQATGNSGFTENTCLWNIANNEVNVLEYNHPDIPKKRTHICVSEKDKIYAECNFLHDLISIFNFKGELIKNIYGPQWKEKNLECFTACTYTDKYLVASYKGEEYGQGFLTYKIEIFTKSGEYVATLNTGYSIESFDYDKIDNRLYFVFDDVIQFGYLDLDDIQL